MLTAESLGSTKQYGVDLFVHREEFTNSRLNKGDGMRKAQIPGKSAGGTAHERPK